MKSITTKIFLCALLLAIVPACKKSAENDSNGNSKLSALLIGAPGHVWQLQDADASTVWEDQIGTGWVQYTNQPGQINLSECAKYNDFMVFKADNSYTQSIYTCNMFETNFPLFNQTGGTGKWTLSADQTLRLENYATYRFISATATDLFIADLYGTCHFMSVSERPFLLPVQYFAGVDTKTWKISKIKVGGVQQPLTNAQISNRLTFSINGAVTNLFANVNYGLPVTGSWVYNASQHKCEYRLPATAQTPALSQQWTVLELTETALTYAYFDDKNNYFTMYWVPQ